MENIPEARLIPTSTQPKTQETGGGWRSTLCPSTWMKFAKSGLKQMAVMTGAYKDIEERIQEETESQEIGPSEQPPINERKAIKTQDEAFRERLLQEVPSTAKQRKYIQRFRIREALVRIHYDSEVRLKKNLTVLGNQDTQAIERGRITNEPSIIKRAILPVEEMSFPTIKESFKPSELLKLALTVDIKTKEEKAQEQGIDSFQNEVVEPNKMNFKLVFDRIQKALTDRKNYPDFGPKEFDPKEFNRENFEKNPINFLIEINSDHNKTDLQAIVNAIARKDPLFDKALNTIKATNENYFERIIFISRALDKEYMADAKNIDKLKYVSKELGWNKLNPLYFDEVITENFGDLWKNATERCVVKEKEQFDHIFSELVKNDSEYQAAQKIVQDTLSKYSEKNPFDFPKVFFENKEFRDAYNVVNRKYQAVCNTTGFQFKYNADFEIDPVDYAESLIKKGMTDAANYVKDNPGRFKYSPLAVAGAALIGWEVLPIIAGSVVIGHVIKQVAPAVTEELEKANVFYDIRQARLDREFRRPLRTKLLSKEFSREEKIEKLQELRAANLLFQEDLEDCPADLLKEIDTSNLPSIEKIKNIRKEHLKILNNVTFKTDKNKENFVTDEIRIDTLNKMANANVLYQEDILNEDSDIQTKFLRQIALLRDDRKGLEDFPSTGNQSDLRNRNLCIAKVVLVTDFERLNIIKKLHAAGVFFKEDLLELEEIFSKENKGYAYLYDQIAAEGLTVDSLPDTATRYQTELSLKAKHDERRENILSKEGNSKDKIPTLKGLQELYEEGLCFKQDLAHIDEETLNGFARFLSERFLKDITTITDSNSKTKLDKDRKNILSKEGNSQNGIPTFNGLKELHNRGLCFKHDLANIDEETRDNFAKFLSQATLADTIDDLPDQDTFYQYGIAKRVAKFGEAVSNLIWRGGEAVYNNPVNVIYGPLKGVKGITQITAKALEETFGTFTDIKTTALSDRLLEILPGNKKLKTHATYITNKTIGTAKWSAIGAGVGAYLFSLFGVGGTVTGMQIGAAIGSFFGACKTDGAVTQIPKGGLTRAFKFASYGALVGAVVAIALIAAGPIGWAAGAAISLYTVIIVASASSSLIVPFMFLGAAAGYYYAGISGTDVETKEKDIADALYYHQPNIESAFLASVPA